MAKVFELFGSLWHLKSWRSEVKLPSCVFLEPLNERPVPELAVSEFVLKLLLRSGQPRLFVHPQDLRPGVVQFGVLSRKVYQRRDPQIVSAVVLSHVCILHCLPFSMKLLAATVKPSIIGSRFTMPAFAGMASFFIFPVPRESRK